MSKTAMFYTSKPGGQFAVEDQSISTGNRFFVDSGATTYGGDVTGKGYSPAYPFLTIDYAISKCTASNGDIIYVMPGHAETYDTAADLEVDVIGITIKGIGIGSNKPTISVDTEHTEQAGVLISAANCKISNFRFVGINAGGSKNTIEISASDVTIEKCDFIETTTDLELGVGAEHGVITLLDTGGAITRINIIDCTYYGLGGSTESFLSVTDGSLGATYVTIDGCTIIGTFADDAIQADAGSNANTNWIIKNSMIVNQGGNNVCITLDTGAVFFMDHLTLFGAGGSIAPLVGFDISYMGDVWTCEPGAYGAVSLIGSVTNWSA